MMKRNHCSHEGKGSLFGAKMLIDFLAIFRTSFEFCHRHDVPIVHVPENVNFEGLITVNLPEAILEGDYFRVVIRRITTRPVLSRKCEMRQSIASVSHSVNEDGAAAPQSEPSHGKKSNGGKSVTS
jgi:hypothetical protein